MAILRVKSECADDMNRVGSDATVGGDDLFTGVLSDSISDIRLNTEFAAPLSARTATMSLNSNAEHTPMSGKENTSAVTPPERPELSKGSEVGGNNEADDFVLSEEDIAHAAKVTIYSRSGKIRMSDAIDRAVAIIPRDLELQRATIRQIQLFFFMSDGPGEKKVAFSFTRSVFLRRIAEEVNKAFAQDSTTGDNMTGMASTAELWAVRFCNPKEMAPRVENRGGLLQTMNKADLTQVEGIQMHEQTPSDPLINHVVNHVDAMDDMKQRIHALETSARHQDLDHLTKKSDVMETAIQDFRMPVKGALDRRLSKDDLDKVTAKYDKALDDLLKQANADRETAKALAEKQAQDLKNLENRLEAFFRGTPLAGRGTITGPACKRPLADASDAGNRSGSTVLMSDDSDVFLDSESLCGASHGGESQAKKRRVDNAMGKMDFSDIF